MYQMQEAQPPNGPTEDRHQKPVQLQQIKQQQQEEEQGWEDQRSVDGIELEKKQQAARQRASKFSEEQIIAILKEAQSKTIKTVCVKHDISEEIFDVWKKKYGHLA